MCTWYHLQWKITYHIWVLQFQVLWQFIYMCYNIGELIHTHTQTLTYRVITVIPPMVARLNLIVWVAYMLLDDLRHVMDQFNILHATINGTFLNITFQGQIFTFSFFQNNQFPLIKMLRLLVCYILYTSIQYCIKTISVAICLRYSGMMTGLLRHNQIPKLVKMSTVLM